VAGGLDQMEKIEQEIAKVNSDIEKVTKQIEALESILEKEYEDWTQKEKNKYGNHDQLREEKNKLREKENKLREKENKLREEKNKLREEKNKLREKGQNFLISGTILLAKKTKGVRSTVYRIASSYLGYHDGERKAFWYEGDDLNIHVLFESKLNADYFRRRLNDESMIHNSAIGQLKVAQLNLSPTQSIIGKEILLTDYNPDDYDSPQNILSLVSGTTSILDSSRPIFKFQRIESDSIFGQHYKACSCHLISREYLNHNSESDDPENNRIALSGDVHNWFDGRSVDVPLFKLTVPSDYLLPRRPLLENRYEVQLLVTAYDSDSARMLFPRLREGYNGVSELEATISVYVLDPKVFKKCVEWKALEIQEKWDSYNNMDPAVA